MEEISAEHKRAVGLPDRPRGLTNRWPAHLSVVFDVVSERDEARLELLGVESSRARLVEVQERAPELLQLLVADALRVARQDLQAHARCQTD